MREMKDSGISWIGNIPINWKVKPNKYIMKKMKKIQVFYEGEDILSLTINGVVVRDLVNPTGKMPTSFDGYQVLSKGNLLMCLFDIDVTPRCIGLIENNGLCSPAYSQFVLNNGYKSKYYYYYYLNLDYKKTLLHMTKNLRYSLTEDLLGAISIPVPPLQEQQKIANFLDKKCEEIESLISDIKEQIETLEQYKKSVITEAVTKGIDKNICMNDSGIDYIGKINPDWKLTKIRYCCTKLNRLVMEDQEPLICSNKAKVFPRGDYSIGLVSDDDKMFQGVGLGDLLIHGMDTWHGAIAISDYYGKCTTVVHVCDSDENKRFISYYLQMYAYKKVYKAISSGVRENTSDFRSWTKMGNVHITLPNKSEQDEIVSYLTKRCLETENIISDKQKQIKTLEEYKKSVIFEYVTGKKEVE